MSTSHDTIRAVLWEDDKLKLLDQRLLPQREIYIEYEDSDAVAQAITDMVVRGAPAIGITAAYGVVLAVRNRIAEGSKDIVSLLERDFTHLADARPTAVNLAWALERMGKVLFDLPEEADVVAEMLAEAKAIHEEDIAANLKMGELGAALIEGEGYAVLTHCNAGALATGGYGTALGVIRSAFEQKKISRVYADETRPWMQGARLTAWEMVKDEIPVTLLGDGAAANLMKQGRVKWVVVGSDRIAANGDVANKIGTLEKAIVARHYGIPFYVAAPVSTIDFDCASGDEIPIEQRHQDEVLYQSGQSADGRLEDVLISSPGSAALNPAFDVTPAGLVTAIITDKGIFKADNLATLNSHG